MVWTISNDVTSGCIPSSDTLTITAYKPPFADFTLAPKQFCAAESVTVTNRSQNANVYQWFWGDGDTSSFINGLHAYPVAGDYVIKLVAKSIVGTAVCVDSATDNIIVLPLPPAGIKVSPLLIQQQPDYTFTFEDTTSPVQPKIYLWSLGDRSQQTRSDSLITYKYGDTGIFKVKLFVTDASTGCKNQDSVQVQVEYIPGYLQVPSAVCLSRLQ